MTSALFLRDGDLFIPTDAARGPWNPDYLHGGPVTGLAAHALTQAAGGAGLRLARLTVDLLRPVPQAPLHADTRLVRPGKRLQVLEMSLYAGDKEVTRASGLFLEQSSIPVPEHGRFPGADDAPPAAAEAKSLSDAAGWGRRYSPHGFHTTAEAVVLAGAQGGGHGRVWMRLPLALVADQPTDPLVAAATLCDFGNGVGQLHLGERLGSINTDVTLYLHRHPQGEWVGLDSRSNMQETGMGLVETTLFDGQGPFGRVLQATIAMAVPGEG